MNSKDVLAVVVSHNGLEQTRQGVHALSKLVERIHIVDNGSDKKSLAVLESEGPGPPVLPRVTGSYALRFRVICI